MATGRCVFVVRPEPALHVRQRRRQRQARLLKLGYQGYGEYLRSSHWQGVKARYRHSELPQDCVCGEQEVHLHHMTYERIGAEALTDLTPLCSNCHAMIHVLERRGEVGLDFAGFFDAGRAIEGRQLLRGLAEQQRRERAAHIKQQQDEIVGLSFAARLMRVRDTARFRRRISITGHLRVMKQMTRDGRTGEPLTRRLRHIEEIVYGWEGWRDAA